MKQKKNKFFTLLFSFLPGAAEMYMGFMKSGISLMAVFCLSIMIPSVFHLSDAFICLAFLVWFYGFFHARNLAAYDEGLIYELHDEFIWESFGCKGTFEITSPVLRKWAAVILIVLGIGMLWATLKDVIYALIPHHLWNVLSPFVDMVPQLAVSVLIIFVGLKLIQGKKEELDGDGKQREDENESC